jgi:hypothetical protein
VLNSKPQPKRGIYRVTHTLMVGKTNMISESDFIFLNGQRFDVLEWEGPLENHHPSLTLPLDPSVLEAARAAR